MGRIFTSPGLAKEMADKLLSENHKGFAVKKIEYGRGRNEFTVIPFEDVLDIHHKSIIYVTRFEAPYFSISDNKDLYYFDSKAKMNSALDLIKRTRTVLYVGEFMKCEEIVKLLPHVVRKSYKKYMNYESGFWDFRQLWQSIESLHNKLGKDKFIIITRK